MVVIGSGPAGMAAAQALCDAGVRVTVLDSGDTAEPDRMTLFDELARFSPHQWRPELLTGVRDAFPADVKRVPLKPAYGSLFPYALDDPDLPIECENAEVISSLARGGLSNAWGASVLPVRQSDIEDWPISLAELEPHYAAVLRFVPLAAERDELCTSLPLYCETPGALRRGAQAELLLAQLRRHAAALDAAGLAFGASRLAVFTAQEDSRRCRHGGLCLYGCPYRSVYNSAQTLDALLRSGRVEYRSGVYVDRLSDHGDSVTVDFHARRRPAERGRLVAGRVFVACGPISSTRLLLESRSAGLRSTRLQDSQYFVIPMLTARAAPVSIATQGNTLAQVFLELQDARIARYPVHLQVYGYNDIMLAALAKRLSLSLPAPAIERILRPLLGRLVVVQGFMHSADSPGLEVVHEPGRLRVLGEDNVPGAVRVRRLVRRLAGLARPLGMIPLPGLLHVGSPGKSNHLGGSLPMRESPGELETDTLGRPSGWSRVHLVDAAVLPSIPATTVTVSVMANAHRIAAAAASL
jgi:choline dehydrogenase-like flavoprotein